jgi:hypothetical protein
MPKKQKAKGKVMADTDAELVAKFRALSIMMEMTDDAIVVAKKALLQNPDKEERRELDEIILELAAKHFKVKNMMLALANDATVMDPPSKSQVDKIAALAEAVDKKTQGNVVASAAIKLTGEVLTTVTNAIS